MSWCDLVQHQKLASQQGVGARTEGAEGLCQENPRTQGSAALGPTLPSRSMQDYNREIEMEG